MGIGDIIYDRAPIQYSQFESDIRIAQCLDNIYFEMGGGGNDFESYTAAWYVGLKRTDCDCWKRGRKGLILTIGDEELNPILNKEPLQIALGESGIQGDILTEHLYKAVSENYNIGHIVVEHHYGRDGYYSRCAETFAEVLGAQNVCKTTPQAIADVVIDFICSKCGDGISSTPCPSLTVDKPDDGTMGVISWS